MSQIRTPAKARVSRRVFCLALAALAVFLPARWASAEAFEVVNSFKGNSGIPIAPLLQARDGRFYGTTLVDGQHVKGSVFRLAPDGVGGFTFETLHEFSGLDGANPYGGLIQASDGSFYGTTCGSGCGGDGPGAVFKIEPDGTLTILHSFDPSTEGASPRSELKLPPPVTPRS